MADNQRDYSDFWQLKDWTPPMDDRVKPFTGMSTVPVPDVQLKSTVPPYVAPSPESGYTPTAPKQTNYSTGYYPSAYNAPAGQQSGGQVSEYGAGMDTWRYGSPADIRKAKYAASQGGSGGSGGSSTDPRRTVSKTTYTQPRPQAPKLPTLKLPKVNKRAIAALQQKHSAGGVRRLRQALQESLAQGSDNPNVRRMTIREALQGYGTGLEGVMAGAYGTARSEHMADVQQQSQEAQLNWQAEVNRQNQMYQQAINEYMASAAKSTTTGLASDVGEPAPAQPPMYLRNAYSTLLPYGQQA